MATPMLIKLVSASYSIFEYEYQYYFMTIVYIVQDNSSL